MLKIAQNRVRRSEGLIIIDCNTRGITDLQLFCSKDILIIEYY